MSATNNTQDKKDKINGPVIGIDLGTTYSCTAIYRNGQIDVIPNESGKRTTPSTVAYRELKGQIQELVGEPAKKQQNKNFKNTIFDSKRCIGHKFDEPAIQEDIKHWPFKVVRGDRGAPKYTILNGKKDSYPVQISAALLKSFVKTAETFLSSQIGGAVVTVPAYFNDAQREETKDACKIAGLNVLRIINEPTAAAIAYGVDKAKTTTVTGEKNILVFDLGGGTFDVTVLTLDDSIYEVKATRGDSHLGGKDFDRIIVDVVAEQVKSTLGLNINGRMELLGAKEQKIRKAVSMMAEDAKIMLSSTTSTDIEIEIDDEYHTFVVSRARFENDLVSYTKKCLDSVKEVIKESGMSKSEIHEVILVGGSTRIPKFRKVLAEFFFGSENHENRLCHGINPDEAVAAGAAIQAALLSDSGQSDSKINDLLLLDVTPFNLGLETAGGVMTTMIEKNKTIPTKYTQTFSTYADNQTSATIKVYQGNREMAKNNHFLGAMDIDGIPPAPRGVPQIEVTYEIDANGSVQIEAVVKSSGKSNKLTINKESMSHTKEDIERFTKEQESNAEKDKEEHEIAMAKNELENTFLMYDRSFRDNKDSDKWTEDEKKEVEKMLEEYRGKTQGVGMSKEECSKLKEEITQKMTPLFAKLHQGQGQGQPGMGMGNMGNMGGMNMGNMGNMGGQPDQGPSEGNDQPHVEEVD